MKLDFENFDFGEALKNCALEENLKNLILNVCKSKRLYLKLDFAKEKNKNDTRESTQFNRNKNR